jgi:sigma-B regulation protein RsbU (phosphoserine phosphatase)
MVEGESILVVEDNRDMRVFLREVLRAHGFRVTEAYSGWKALQLAESSSPDALLLDWALPDITGLDVLRALRAGHCLSPAILMTAYGSEELAILALRLGVRDYLRKPFEEEELIKAVESALTESRLRRERDMLREQLAQSTQWLDRYAHQIARVKSPLIKLAFLADDLKRSRDENWRTRVEEMRNHIRQIAEALEGLASAPRR